MGLEIPSCRERYIDVLEVERLCGCAEKYFGTVAKMQESVNAIRLSSSLAAVSWYNHQYLLLIVAVFAAGFGDPVDSTPQG